MFVQEIKTWFKNRLFKREKPSNKPKESYELYKAGASFTRVDLDRTRYSGYEYNKVTGALYQDVWIMGESTPRKKLVGYTDEEIRDYFVTCHKDDLPNPMSILRPQFNNEIES